MENKVMIFISQRMHGRKEIEVLVEREVIKTMLVEAGVLNFEIIDQYHVKDAPKDVSRVWYLGRSIGLMDKADVVIFANDYKKASGTLVERVICHEYGIPVLTMQDLLELKSANRKDILLIDINKRRVDLNRKELKTL